MNQTLKTRIFISLTAFLLGTAYALAQSAEPLSPFDQQVRDTLLKHPQIILEVFKKIQVEEEISAAQSDVDLIQTYQKALFEPHKNEIPDIVEFVDYNCGYCRKAFLQTQAFQEQNPDIIIRSIQFPILGEGSNLAARIALVVERDHPEKFNALHKSFMSTETRLELGNISKILTALTLNSEQLIEQAGSSEFTQIIIQNHALARNLNITGTPAFVGPSKIIRGLPDLNALKALAEPIT